MDAEKERVSRGVASLPLHWQTPLSDDAFPCLRSDIVVCIFVRLNDELRLPWRTSPCRLVVEPNQVSGVVCLRSGSSSRRQLQPTTNPLLTLITTKLGLIVTWIEVNTHFSIHNCEWRCLCGNTDYTNSSLQPSAMSFIPKRGISTLIPPKVWPASRPAPLSNSQMY